MDINQRVTLLESIVGGDEEESTLLAYLQIAGQAILNKAYPYYSPSNPTDVPEKYQVLQVEIAAAAMNKRGAESETQHIENGIHRNYQNAYIPDDMLRQVVPNVGLLL